MQFKSPELFWALFLLLIPIFIHLFQLRRFKKTPFTNVKLLQKIVSQSRRSNTLKKWLVLCTRLLLFTALIIAFAQPYLAKMTALQEKETVIYLDDSFSMQIKTDEGVLLETAIQELIKSVPNDKTFSLFTNALEFRDVDFKDIQNDLLTLKATPKQLDLKEIGLKASTLFSKEENTLKNLVIISDFQQRILPPNFDTISAFEQHLVQLASNDLANVSLDTLFMGNHGDETIELTARLSSNSDIQSIPVSLFDENKLIAKTSAVFNDNQGEVVFTIAAGEAIKGKLELVDSGLSYDNYLYFNIDTKEKPKVLVLGDADPDYLGRIYTPDEFIVTEYTIKDLNYQDIEEQNLIVLNGMETIPNSLVASLTTYVDKGGHLVIIPDMDPNIEAYNQLLSRLSLGSYTEKVIADQNITQITFEHPLYLNVFEKRIDNFQYPKVSEYLKVGTRTPSILSYQDGSPFLAGNNGTYMFTASLANKNSNFKQSPLIVPTFYKMGINSLKVADLYHTVGGLVELDVVQSLSKDEILKVFKEDYEFIPQQQTHANKVSLTFTDSPQIDGTFGVSQGDTTLVNLSFNYTREESNLHYLELDDLQHTSIQGSINALFQQLQNEDRVIALWKWFVILAVLFILIEVLLIKYLK